LSKISEYENKDIPVLNDKLVGSDSESSNETKNFKLEDIKDALGGTGDVVFNASDISNVEGIAFKDGQEITWNADYKTMNIPTGLGPVIQSGQELVFLVENNTGITIEDGRVVKISGSVDVPNISLARADYFNNCGGTLLMTTMQIPTGTRGFATITGVVNDVDLGASPVSMPLWLSPTEWGGFTTTKPEFPSFALSIGGVLEAGATGKIGVNFPDNVANTFDNVHNGTFREQLDFRVTSTGGVITGALSPSNGHDDMTMIFSDGFSILTSTPDVTIVLTAGTDIAPVENCVYIPITTKVLTIGIDCFPDDVEYIPVARILLQSATATENQGALRNQNINNALADANTHIGHTQHVGERIRRMDADWNSGIVGSITISGTPDDVYLATTVGEVYQMHKQTFPALNMATGDDVHIINDPNTAYRTSNNLNDLTVDANGDSIDGKFFNIVVWGVANKTGETSHLMINLPNGSYGKNTDAWKNKDGKDVYTIPDSFKGVGFLIGRYTLYKSGTTWLYDSATGYLDLRGFKPNTTAGSGVGGSGVTEFVGLDDTPATHVADNFLVCNAGGTGLEYITLAQLKTLLGI